MQIPITSTIYLFAVLQALFLIGVLWRKRQHLLSEKYLIVALAMLSITLLHYVALLNFVVYVPQALLDLSAVSWLGISPMLYLYIRSIVHSEEKWHWRKLLYFPFSIYLFIQMLLVSMNVSIGFYQLFSSQNSYNTSWILLYLLNSLGFTVASIYLLRRSKFPKKKEGKLRWLKLYFKVFAVVLSSLIIYLFWCLNADYFFHQLEYVLLICYAVFVFSLVISILRHSTYLPDLSQTAYRYEAKNETELSHQAKCLDQLMQEQSLYLNPKLTLSMLAIAAQLSENQLSQIFTQHLNISFYQYINQYRLASFKNHVKTHGTTQYTIMAIAEMSGFASRATFYKVFKSTYHTTPSAYIKQIKMEMDC